MKFSQDFRADFCRLMDQIELEMPIVFNRFADGELAILERRDIPTADGWSAADATDEYRRRLLAALQYRAPNYFLGIGCPCCDYEGWQRLMELSGREPNDPQVTFSNVFVNGNYDLFRSHSPSAWLISPQRNMVNITDDQLEGAVSAGVDHIANMATRPIYLAAGPFSKILAWEAHLCGVASVPIIDVGSAVDTSGRSYHDPFNYNRKKICRWDATSA